MRRFALGAFVASLIVATAGNAAASPSTATQIGVGSPLDLDAFQRSVALRYDIHFTKVVAADFDRDGDTDVVAATDLGVLVWVNDGHGHLISSQPPVHAPSLAGGAGGDGWQDSGAHIEESIQNDLRPIPVPSASAHAPPTVAAPLRTPPRRPAPLNPSLGCSESRAPPA